ncbi:hypothetical protein ANO11243_081200 [Dothideomycetidae sp. 11243]|nr:hypothetical protein ANO11243_081200 [fungal sp. No.11243]
MLFLSLAGLLLGSATALSIPKPHSFTGSQSVVAPTNAPNINLFTNPLFDGSGEIIPAKGYNNLNLPSWTTSGMVSQAPHDYAQGWNKYGNTLALNTGINISRTSISQTVSGLLSGKYYKISWFDSLSCNSMVDWPIDKANCTFTVDVDDHSIFSRTTEHNEILQEQQTWQHSGSFAFQATSSEHTIAFITMPHFEAHTGGGSTWRFQNVTLTGPWDSA